MGLTETTRQRLAAASQRVDREGSSSSVLSTPGRQDSAPGRWQTAVEPIHPSARCYGPHSLLRIAVMSDGLGGLGVEAGDGGVKR